MATPTLRESVLHVTGSGNRTVTTAAGTQVNDVLVCIHGSDYYDAANMVSPTGTAGTWTLRATGDLGVNNSHLKIWTRKVTVGGAQTVTTAPISDEENWNTTYVLAGADPDSPADGAAGFSSVAGSTAHTAPSVSPVTSDALLVCAVISPLFALVSYSAVTSPLTIRNEDDNQSTMVTGSGALAASGPTGTKAFTCDSAVGWASVSLAVKGAAVSTRPLVTKVASRAAVVRAGSW